MLLALAKISEAQGEAHLFDGVDGLACECDVFAARQLYADLDLLFDFDFGRSQHETTARADVADDSSASA